MMKNISEEVDFAKALSLYAKIIIKMHSDFGSDYTHLSGERNQLMLKGVVSNFIVLIKSPTLQGTSNLLRMAFGCRNMSGV
jgi:hypothetical protein